jgi:hypothetical protein
MTGMPRSLRSSAGAPRGSIRGLVPDDSASRSAASTIRACSFSSFALCTAASSLDTFDLLDDLVNRCPVM